MSLTDLMVVKSEDRELNTNIASPSSPSLELKNEANDSPAPPGFPPKSNLEVASDFGLRDEQVFTLKKLCSQFSHSF